MTIPEVASLFGGAALGAPFSEILKLLIKGAKQVTDFKPLSQDLASTMEGLVPLFDEIDSMQRGSGTDELRFLIKTMLRAEEMVRKCSRVQWYSIPKRALYTKEIKEIHQDFLRFCQIELQLIQHRNQLHYMRFLETVTTKIDLLSVTKKESSELFLVPLPEEVTICWLGRPLRELKKMLFEDGVVTAVVSASSACGKTTLVTKLCHDADVKGKFKHILFITVSNAPNLRLTVQRLLEHTGCNLNASNFDARLCIQQLLMQLTQSGSVLLVLDDVWPEEESFLEKFLIQLPDNKILVTSRFEFPSFGPTFHLERFIDEDVKNLFIEFAPDPNCASCSKLDHSLQKVLKRCNGLPLAMNQSIFDGCNSVIEHGDSVDVLGALLHHECQQCDACHKPIATQEVENHVLNSRGKFHKSCYVRYCYVCKEKVKIRMFNQHPFWKENYCPAHESDGTLKCCCCQRLEPRGMNFVMLEDRRSLCVECMESAIMDTDEVQPLHLEIREFFEGLNMKIQKEFPVLLVEKQTLNKPEEEKMEYEVVTRARCLSKELRKSMVSKGPRMGPNNQLIGISTESQRVVRECEITAILIIYGLPRLLTGYLLAREMMHAWLRLNGCRNLNKVLEAGICQVLGHMWLDSYTYAPTDASGSKGAGESSVCSIFEKKLVEFCKNQIETDDSPVYGLGFKKVYEMVTETGLQQTLKAIIRRS